MKTLYCTVGGTPQPILTSIEKWKPDHVVFVASEDDPSTGKKGSWTEVMEKTADGPAIPARAGLKENTWTLLKVPADNPDEITRLVRQDAEQRAGDVLIDFTGGTKSMSAGAYLAASLTPRAEAVLVTGPRADKVKVVDGMQTGKKVQTKLVRDELLRRACEGAWRRFAWREAANVLDDAEGTAPALERVRVVSLGLAAWDDGDYGKAAELLRPMGKFLAAEHNQAIAKLAEGGDDGEPWMIWDLYLAARRAGDTGKRDVGVLLLYRCVEWVAQWSLRKHHGVDASDVGASDVGARPELDELVSLGRNGKKVMGLVQCWKALARLGGPFSTVADAVAASLPGFVEYRNRSRLAHGTKPVSADDFARALHWFDEKLRSKFLEAAFKGKDPFPQLPNDAHRLSDAAAKCRSA